MVVEMEQRERKRIKFANKVIPNKVRMFFPEEKRYRETYFIKGLLVSCITTEYVLTILITFLTDVWGLKLLDAVLVTNLQEGLTSILEIYMVYLADSRLGYFWLLFFGTIAYCIGLDLLSHSYPTFTQGEIDRCTNYNECPSKHPKFLFYFALILITMGKSSTTSSLEKMKPAKAKRKGRDREEVTTTHRKEKKNIRYSWFMLMVLGSVAGSFALPYVPIGWNIELQVCAYMMAVGFAIYSLGTLFYSPVRGQGSPLSSVRRVVISAFRYRHLSYAEVESLNPQLPDIVELEETTHGVHIDHSNEEDDDDDDIATVHESAGHRRNDGPESDDEIGVGDFMSQDEDANHAQQPDSPALSKGILRFLNKAAANPSCKVQDIEDTKQFIELFPMTLTFLMYGIVNSIGNTFFFEQATNMDSRIGSIHNFPIAGFALMAKVVAISTSKIYDLIMERQRRSIRRKSDGIKIGLGLFLSIFCCIAAWSVEAERLEVIKDYGLLQESNYTIPMSVFWLTPQFVLLGAMNGLTEDGVEGFFKHLAPSSMKRYASALAEGVLGAGTILSLGMIFTLKKLTGRDGRVGWFAETIDESRLDSFYKVLSVVSAINIGFFAVVGFCCYFDQPMLDNGESSNKAALNEEEEE